MDRAKQEDYSKKNICKYLKKAIEDSKYESF
ncbi:TPA: hypothetical protein RHK77_002312 [Enterococcus faecalis]|nr:hypothetical protein [Enterococcus faecalis]HDV0868100.1 hypothetical protein [Enterococcus faecalis]